LKPFFRAKFNRVENAQRSFLVPPEKKRRRIRRKENESA